MTIFTRIAAFFTAIITLLNISFQKKTSPEYAQTPAHTQASFDDGTFTPDDVNLFVSPDGSDSADGSEAHPLASPAGAKAFAKSLAADGRHVTVWFRGGVYPVTEPLRFTADDRQNVTYRAYPGEDVSFSGARKIGGFTETTVNGVRAFVTALDGDLPADSVNAVYRGEKRLPRPVYPKTGTFTVQNAKEEDAFNPGDNFFSLHGAFYADPKDCMQFRNLGDADVRILHYWCDELLPLASVNPATGRIETQKPASMTINAGDRYFYENVFEALSEPGEWYFDRAAHKLYYIPEPQETAADTVLSVGQTEQLITVTGCSGIEFRSITFRDTDWTMRSGSFFTEKVTNSTLPLRENIRYMANFPQACYDMPCAVQIEKSSGVTFLHCAFRCIGASALGFGTGSAGCEVKTCLFENIGANGVYIKGVRDLQSAEKVHDIAVTDCHIRSYGRVFNNAIGILLIDAADCDLSHNEIHDGFYTAISVGWVWGYAENPTDSVRICDNLIYDIGQGWLSDMGGIYTLGIQPHTVISGNVIHHVGCYAGDSGYGGWGIYLDEGSSGITVEKNLVYRCSSESFHQHYGKENVIRNNIFACSGDAQVRCSRTEDHVSFYLINNIIVGDNAPIYLNYALDRPFRDSGNYYWDLSKKQHIRSGDSMRLFKSKNYIAMCMRGYYVDGILADPMFRDPANDDFTPAANCKAVQNGFELWDTGAAGTLTLFE